MGKRAEKESGRKGKLLTQISMMGIIFMTRSMGRESFDGSLVMSIEVDMRWMREMVLES